MKKSTKIDLNDVQACMESLAAAWPKMELAERIDVAARLKPVMKHCEVIDDSVKAAIKEHLSGEAGEVPGEVFKAVMRLDPVTRLDQKMLKLEYPKAHARCMVAAVNKVITFTAR